MRDMGDRRLTGTALNDINFALVREGRFEEAIDAHQAAVAIMQEFEDRHGEAETLANLGTARLLVGRSDEAITRIPGRGRHL